MKKIFKKILMILGGITLGFILLFVGVYLFVSLTSKKLVCKAEEGNITIMYNKETITGYKAFGLGYNMEEQKVYANQVGIEKYIEEFSEYFKSNFNGSCK